MAVQKHTFGAIQCQSERILRSTNPKIRARNARTVLFPWPRYYENSFVPDAGKFAMKFGAKIGSGDL